jgi:hypothetical protein
MYANLFRLFADEIKVDTEDDPQRARIIAFSVWGILRGLESFSQLIYTNSQYPGLVSTNKGAFIGIFTHKITLCFEFVSRIWAA